MAVEKTLSILILVEGPEVARQQQAKRQRRALNKDCSATGSGHVANTLAPQQDFNPDEGELNSIHVQSPRKGHGLKKFLPALA